MPVTQDYKLAIEFTPAELSEIRRGLLLRMELLQERMDRRARKGEDNQNAAELMSVAQSALIKAAQ